MRKQKWLWVFCLVSIFLFSPVSSADSGSNAKPYLSSVKPLLDLTNVHDAARAWGVCAAAYNVTSEIYEELLEQPAQAKQMRQLSNGAEVVIAVMYLLDGLKDIEEDDFDHMSKAFKSSWEYGKEAMNSIPETQYVSMVADGERLVMAGADYKEFVDSIFMTTRVCVESLEVQQMHIDIYRDFVRKGWLAQPEK
ncbi:MAG: hypothetical protein AB2689_25290 [Candidatus Thiodiazotropha taylori]